MDELTDVYNELIMEHSMNSYNKKKLENADYCEVGHNPNCGDEITLQLKLNGNKIEDMAFSGHGCAISQASTSIMIDTLKGKTVEEAKEIIKTFIEMIKRETTDEKELKKLEDAKKFISFLNGKTAIILDVKKVKQKENAPLLFNLAEIQNECTKKFKIKPDETLNIIQNLYEKKLVTYPRTDARVLSTAVAKQINKNLNGLAKNYKDEAIQSFINQMIEKKYSTNLINTKYVNDNKITDHYAIIPTGHGFENLNELPEIQQKIYNIIVKRFLAIFYPPAEFNKISSTIRNRK